MIVKVKEPQPAECALLRRDQVLFTYLHLAADPAQAEALMRSQCVAIAYETVTAADGSLPLLTPMSEVAGRMSVQVGRAYLEKGQGRPRRAARRRSRCGTGQVVVIGAGVAGTNALEMAHGLGAACHHHRSFDPPLRDLDGISRRSAHAIFDRRCDRGRASPTPIS